MPWIQTFLDFFFEPRDTELLLRAATKDALMPFLHPRVVHTTIPATIALLPFHEPLVRAAIHEAKYAGTTKAQKLLANVLGAYLTTAQSELMHAQVIPLPLSRMRFTERGFNQCERVLAHLKAPPPLAPADTLVRNKDTEHQTRLSKTKRAKNIRHAFSAHVHDPHIPYILFDDVITTGATMQAAIDAVRGAGALHIIPIALAH